MTKCPPSKKIFNNLIGQTFPRKLLGLIVHGLYLLPINIFQWSVKTLTELVSVMLAESCPTVDYKMPAKKDLVEVKHHTYNRQT